MATMTLNMTVSEMAALDAMAVDLGMSKTAVMRQALRLYQAAHHHGRQGAQISFLMPDGRRVEALLPMLLPSFASPVAEGGCNCKRPTVVKCDACLGAGETHSGTSTSARTCIACAGSGRRTPAPTGNADGGV